MRKAFARTLALVMTMAVVLTGCSSSGDKSSTNTSASGSGSATNWLKDTVTMVVPYSAGGDTDTYCRQMSKLLGEKLGVNFVVVNTTGGSGVVGVVGVVGTGVGFMLWLYSRTRRLISSPAASMNRASPSTTASLLTLTR